MGVRGISTVLLYFGDCQKTVSFGLREAGDLG